MTAPLERYTAHGLFRCQAARTRDGAQCKQAAARKQNICTSHRKRADRLRARVSQGVPPTGRMVRAWKVTP